MKLQAKIMRVTYKLQIRLSLAMLLALSIARRVDHDLTGLNVLSW